VFSAHNALSNVVSNMISAGGGGVSVTSNELSAVSAQAASALSQAVSVLSQSLSVTNAGISNLTSAHNALSNVVSGLGGGGASVTSNELSNVLSAHNALSNTVSAAGGSGAVYVVKATNETVSSNSTLHDDASLFFSVVVSSLYEFDLTLYLQAGNANSDWKFAWNVPSGTTMLWGSHGDGSTQWAAGTAAAGASPLDTESTSAVGGSGPGINGRVYKGKVRTAGTAGTVGLRWSQNSVNASDSTVLADSYIRHKKIV
jgi:hypothetical protein